LQGVLLPRIFRRPAGQLVCRADATEHAAFFLTVLRNAPELLDASKVGATGWRMTVPDSISGT
jgi:hypothetical protein